MILPVLKNIYFLIIPTFLIIVGLKLFFPKNSLPKKILGLYFIIYSIRIIAAFFLEEFHTSFSIHFYKLQSIIFYIIPPLGFLFIRYSLQPLRRFRYFDFLHFLPALIHFSELIPFIFGPVELKYKDLAIARATPSFGYHYETIAGFIPIKIHFYLKFISHFIYYFLSFKIWYRYGRYNQSIFYKNNKILIRWVGADIMLKIISLVVILLYGFGLIKKDGFTFSISDYFLLLDVLFHFGFYLFYPKLLNGAIFELLALEKHYLGPVETGLKSVANLKKLQEYIEINVPYLDEEFTLKKLAIGLNINERTISKIIYDHYKMSFPDYVGSLRLKYLKKIVLEEVNLQNTSIEKLAEISGFGSRQALYKVVQRLHQMTPYQFLEISSSIPER